MRVKQPSHGINQCKPTILNNKMYIIIHDKKKNVLIGVTMSGDRNVIKKEAEKIQIYIKTF
jgi:hypothetical protein